jgi:L-rhamnose-H+ transport protein
MIAPNPIMGTGLHALGGISAASCYLPYQKTKWSWGSFWIVQANFAWVIVPLLIAFLTVPDLVSVFRESPPSAIFIPMLLGAIYGFGGMSFGFAIRHIGYSMTYTLAIGISSIVGFLVPLILAGNITAFFTATGGGTLLLGIFLSLTGIFLCGAAGYKKERFLKSASPGGQGFNMGRGLALTIFAGILSGIFGVGLELAQPIADVAASHGAGHFEGNARIIAPSIGCYITNIIWFVVAGIRNKSIKELNPRNAATSKGYTRNFLFSALGGSLWYIQFFFYGLGHVRMGKFMAASWVIHMSMLIFFSYIVGILMKEWKNLKKSIIVVLIAGLLVLITSFIVMSIGTLQAEGGL